MRLKDVIARSEEYEVIRATKQSPNGEVSYSNMRLLRSLRSLAMTLNLPITKKINKGAYEKRGDAL